MEIDDILEEDFLSIFNSFESSDNGKVKDTKIAEPKGEKSVELELDEDFQIEEPESVQRPSTKVLEIDSSNVDNFALLLKELLNNKTIEISIKIKEN